MPLHGRSTILGIAATCLIATGALLQDNVTPKELSASPVRSNSKHVAAAQEPKLHVVNRPEYPPPRLVLLKPGTVVGNTAPDGWSHLVLKSMPRIHPEHRSKVNKQTYRMSSLVFTAVAANVRPTTNSDGQNQYEIGNIGIGMGTSIRGQDTVITPETKNRFGVKFGFLEGILLSTCYEKLMMARLRAHTPTMAVIDTHAVMVRGQGHRPAIMRHILLVDAPTGRLETLSFGIDIDERNQYLGVNTHMEWLRGNAIDDCLLYVDRREFTVGIPSDNAFAVKSPPKGRMTVQFTKSLADLAGQSALNAESLQTLERGLRQALWSAATRKTSSGLADGYSAR
ncbi:hypothetical protein [Thalassoroseus pseudoceratinae]|uniref:hypothetical protein n=1 Tax=Thalassoroseus pseudoceratinae TaxID=2713176 RepID=UPI00141F4FD7|nr:hypothetical protein [Thalassoroseus pseudoceratinae]